MRLMDRIRRRDRFRKVFVIGLDCAAPELVFDRWRSDLPNFTYLAENGIWGDLQSCIPAITVPAWTCMLSGKDPGELGIYGFRNRSDHSYNGRFIATGEALSASAEMPSPAGLMRPAAPWRILLRQPGGPLPVPWRCRLPSGSAPGLRRFPAVLIDRV